MVMHDARTRLYLLLGNPVKHSLSPALHNCAFGAQGINSTYLASQVEHENLNAALQGMKALAIAGANVTYPFKEAVVQYLDSISLEAESVNAVNTIINSKGKLHGEITDGEGLFASLKEIFPAFEQNSRVAVIGAGGACRSAAYTLADKGAERVTIFNRTVEKAEALSDLLQSKTAVGTSAYYPLEKELLKEALGDHSLIIYGLPFDSDLFMEAIRENPLPVENTLLYDLRYNPYQTEVMKLFKAEGGRCCNGLGMLLWQAVYAYELFTGRTAPVEVMKKAVGYENY